ncbi:L-seryl-tRNA(Sec) selenium transferase [Fictibacillus iocasae]|uniref:L-seryl-tRNA(Sec) selenium transferase n=1 Tax=Fictibacillus iocasae TaxID=2715437 RepID=A0ABW2NN69_9BACL
MDKQLLLKKLPAVHKAVAQLIDLTDLQEYSEKKLTYAAKKALQGMRHDILNDQLTYSADLNAELYSRVTYILINEKTLKRVINAAGVVIHTNLGRSRLGKRAMNALVESAENYSSLEYSIVDGKRGSRHVHIEELIKQLTGAESAIVVNNNAAAVYLILNALSKGQETIVSRGELVEIGGSFRISSIMEESGAILKEIGTTNKTHLYDYERAVNENTAMIMKVHTSNFKITGFTKSISSSELVRIAQSSGIILYEDLGSGALYDFNKKHVGDEPMVREVLNSGVDLVSFSGDKLLGGPQAGIIAGKKEYIDLLKSHQLARVLRIDKLSLAALYGTLESYLLKEYDDIPTIRDLIASTEELKMRTASFAVRMESRFNPIMVDGFSQVGGGTMPDVKLPSPLIAFCHPKGADFTARSLRSFKIPIIVRIQENVCLIDLRSVTVPEEDILLSALKAI